MGGYNSGRQSNRSCTDAMLTLDIRLLHRAGRLAPGQLFSWRWSSSGRLIGEINLSSNVDQVSLRYRQRDQKGDWQAMEYQVRLSWTKCHHGGQRAWWLCPAAGCGRRVAILYGGAVFACRHCHRLIYQCQRETPDDRAIRQADKLRDRLGWQAGILNGDGGKPKGMHWKTYQRLRIHHDMLVQVGLLGIGRKFGILRNPTNR